MTASVADAPTPPDPDTREHDAPRPDTTEVRPRWARPALIVLLVGTGVAYLINLSSQKWGNAFYAAAVQAGSVSWKAFLFGSSDAANSITVDKPPASLWLMEISVRIFGLNSWSLLAPQVLLGVASVGVLYAAVTRAFGARAGLLAGLILALTPTAALMFRYDNPDALLTFLMVCAAWAMLRAFSSGGRTRWVVATGVFIGFGFVAKQLEVLLPLPGLALAYLLFGPPQLRTRVWQLLAAGAAMVVSAGWWVAVVALTPAADRPWVGGSSTNSIIDLTLGYNGLGRLTGNEGRGGAPRPTEQQLAELFPEGVPGAGGNFAGGGFGGFGGRTGITRLFSDMVGGQIAWLIPAALILLAAGIALRGRAPRTDNRRAFFVMWGVWLIGAGVVFSFMSGTFHPYYTMTLAPAIAAIIGAGTAELWRIREKYWARAVLAVSVAVTVVTGFVFLGRTPDFVPWLRWVILVGGLLAAAALLIRTTSARTTVTRAAALLAVLACLGGPTAYVVHTIAHSHTGGSVTAGPSTAGGFGGGGRDRGPQADAQQQDASNAARAFGFEASDPSPAVVADLEQNASSYTWVAATIGSNGAAGYQLATRDPVMPIGGFSGTDPSPTLAQFQQYVRQGRIHFFIAAGTGGRTRPSEIGNWVASTFPSTTVDGVTLFDLTPHPGGASVPS